MSADKTEQPTPKKLRDSRNEGQIAKSQELPATATTITLFAVIFMFMGFFFNVLEELFLLPIDVMNRPFDEVFYPTLLAVLACCAKIVLPIVLSVMLWL